MTGQDRRVVAVYETNAGVDTFHMAARNVDAGTYAVNAIDAGGLTAQWTPQRAGIVYDQSGKTYWVQIETASNDLEIFANNATGWQIDGTWALLDDDASQNWEAVDVEVRQSVVRAAAYQGTNLHDCSINLRAGTPNWIISLSAAIDNSLFSLTLDGNLLGTRHLATHEGGNLKYRYFVEQPITNAFNIAVGAASNNPQIVTDKEARLWVFYVVANVLQVQTSFSDPFSTAWASSNIVHTATDLTSAYMASQRPEDDSVHVVLLDHVAGFPNSTFNLIYLRRTANGWSAPITVDTWALDVAGGAAAQQLLRMTPQITNQSNGVIINNIEYNSGDSEGQLNAYFLANADYHDPVAGNWIQTADIATGIDVVGCNAPEYWPAK